MRPITSLSAAPRVGVDVRRPTAGAIGVIIIPRLR
jgi:hypothetical protein